VSFNTILAARQAARLTAWKDPAVIAVASSVELSGLQLLQSVQLAANDRVLVIDGVNAGVWIASANAWGRSEDTRVNGTLRRGTRIPVESGTYLGKVLRLATQNPILIGTTSQTWEEDVAPAANLDPSGTLELAKANSPGVTVGSGAPTPHSPTFDARCSSFRVRDATPAFDFLLTAGTSTLTCEDLEFDCASWNLNVATGMGTICDGDCTWTIDGGFDVVAGNFQVSALDGVAICSAASPDFAAAGTVKIKADTLVKIDAPAVALNGLTRYVRCSTTSADSLSGLAARDGVTPIAGDRVLVKDHGTASSTGIYVAAAGAWARAVDMPTGAVIPGMVVEVREGTANGGKLFHVVDLTGPVTVGTDDMTWEEIAGGGGGGGTSISQAGGSVAVDGSGIITATSADGATLIVSDLIELNYPSGSVHIGEDDAGASQADQTNIAAATQITETVGSASRTATASGTARTETYGGALTQTAGGAFLAQSGGATDARVTAPNGRTAYLGQASGVAANPGPNATVSGVTTVVTSYSSLNLRSEADFVRCYAAGGRVELMSSTRQTACMGNDGSDPIVLRFPATVTPPSSAATSLGTITVAASSAGTVSGELVMRVDASNAKSIAFRFGWNASGTVVATYGMQEVGTSLLQGTVATVLADLVASTTGASLVITPTVANASGIKCGIRNITWSVQ
jgi:hypothetical protein